VTDQASSWWTFSETQVLAETSAGWGQLVLGNEYLMGGIKVGTINAGFPIL